MTEDRIDELSGRVEVLVESAGTGLAFLAVLALASLLPGGLVAVIGLPAGFGPLERHRRINTGPLVRFGSREMMREV